MSAIVEPDYLVIDDLSAGYNGRAALTGVTMSIARGAQMAIVGPNGAGKSTLFKAFVGLLPAQSGRITVGGRPLAEHRDLIAYIPQREEVDWSFPITVAEAVMMGRYGLLGWLRRPRRSDHEAVRACLDDLEIADLADRSLGELSGGQQQRVFLARALAQEPEILLLDEPFTGVDIAARETFFSLLERFRQRRLTVLVSTHDMEAAAERFDLVALLRGRLVSYGTSESVFTPEHITAAFGGQALFINGMVVIDQCCPGHVGDGEGHRHSHEPHEEVR